MLSVGFERVLACIDRALELEYPAVKVNCVVMKGINDDEIFNFVELTKDKPISVRFIEYMPFDGNKWSDSKMVPYKKLIESIESHYRGSIERITDESNDTAKVFSNLHFIQIA